MPFRKLNDQGFIDMENDKRYGNADSKTNVYVWDESYKMISIVTKKALNEFMKEELTKNLHKIIGLDCEAGIPPEEVAAEKAKYGFAISRNLKVSSLQLAMPGYLYFIDIQVLSEDEKMDEEAWKKFFQTLFHPERTIVGFSLINDFRFINARFPFLRELMRESKKMLCLSQLSEAIRKNGEKQTFEIIFENRHPSNNSLAALSYHILGLEMDKYFQKKNWTHRPLSPKKKLYAVTDALVVVLLKDEIQYRLELKMDADKAFEIMEKGILKNLKF
uniref:3'-5' exonuclease domain-containing protein n=1 Tax=Panagrolaimus sp. ES5 TaxID=591445 RepID=A0AC34GND8_9BILA